MSDVHLHNGLPYSVNSEGRCDWYNCTHNVYNSFDEPEVDYEAEFLDPQQFDEALLAREAEEGYDVEKLKPRLTFDARVKHFWLLAEPAYQRFDELTKARINRALDVFREDYDG